MVHTSSFHTFDCEMVLCASCVLCISHLREMFDRHICDFGSDINASTLALCCLCMYCTGSFLGYLMAVFHIQRLENIK